MATAVWNFLKAHWQTILLVVVIVVGYGWIHHQQAGFAKAIADLNAAHQAEIDKINTARTKEEQEHAAELKQLQDSMAKIEADFAAAQAALDDQKNQERKDIVKKYGNDADGLAGLLADRLGFVVVKP